MLALHLSAGHAAAQVLNLGDPAPPGLGESATCRTVAGELRLRAQQLRRGIPHTTGQSAEAAALDAAAGAQAQWRDLAAALLDRPDPLGESRTVLLGWRLVQVGDELDHEILRRLSETWPEDEAHEDAAWLLRRFAQAPLPESGQGVGALSAAAMLLLEALSVEPRGGPEVAEEIESLRMLAQNDPDFAPALVVLARVEFMSAHGGASGLIDDLLCATREIADAVKALDSTSWLAPLWPQHRAAAIAAALEEQRTPSPLPAPSPTENLRAMAKCARLLSELAQHPPSIRMRSGAFPATAQRWSEAALSGRESPPWILLHAALESAVARRAGRADRADPTQRDMRLACKALDDQSDDLERLMGEFLAGAPAQDVVSDPSWATLIGQHRANQVQRRMLAEIPTAIEAIGRLDRRATAQIWPRISPLAQSMSDPRSRNALLEMAGEIDVFARRRLALPGEDQWRSNAGWVSEIAEGHRTGILQRLDDLRLKRAEELASGASAQPSALDLAAMHDLFRLSVLWRDLKESATGATALTRDGLAWPADLPGREAAALRDSLRRAAALASSGGVQFQRAVSGARREAAGAIILAHLMREIPPRASEPRGCVAALDLVATHCSAKRREASARGRIPQWCALQFEADQPGGDEIRTYRKFLSERIAEALWSGADD